MPGLQEQAKEAFSSNDDSVNPRITHGQRIYVDSLNDNDDDTSDDGNNDTSMPGLQERAQVNSSSNDDSVIQHDTHG